MPSCAAIARGTRVKITFNGVMAFPNWRLVSQYARRMSGFRGDSMGVIRMVVSCDDGRGRRVVALHSPAVVHERKRAEHGAGRDAESDPQAVSHESTRARDAAHVMPSISRAGT